jgi:hypothetical protein
LVHLHRPLEHARGTMALKRREEEVSEPQHAFVRAKLACESSSATQLDGCEAAHIRTGGWSYSELGVQALHVRMVIGEGVSNLGASPNMKALCSLLPSLPLTEVPKEAAAVGACGRAGVLPRG